MKQRAEGAQSVFDFESLPKVCQMMENDEEFMFYMRWLKH
jgi:hypothetical protein